MKYMIVLRTGLPLAAALLLGACAQPDGEISSADSPEAGLDMSKGPNKVTADSYAFTAIATGDAAFATVDADGNVAPFGMASRAMREVQPAPVAAVVASASNSAVYVTNCAACHGADAKGVTGLGLDLTASQLVAESSPAELVAFLKIGRMPGSPDSLTDVPMPAFSWMAAADLDEISVYLQSL